MLEVEANYGCHGLNCIRQNRYISTQLLPKNQIEARRPQGPYIMLPELTLSALPRYVWLGIKVMASIAGLYTLASPSPWAGFDRDAMAHLAAKKTIDYDPVVTGSVPKAGQRAGKKPIKV